MSTLRLVTAATTTNPNVHDVFINDMGQPEIIGISITDASDYALSVAQSVVCRLKLIRGEWYQDQRVGTPWRERIWKKGTSEGALRRMIDQVVSTTPGVKAVAGMDITIDKASRTATISNLAVTTETGIMVTVISLDSPMLIEAPRSS